MKKLYLVSLMFILSMMLFGCGTTGDNGEIANEGASNNEEQTHEQTHEEEVASKELPSKEQPTIEENIADKDKDAINQTETDRRFTETILYENTEYGFTFSLPKSWEDYQIVTDSWKGIDTDKQQNKIVENGSIISIRHPEWTAETPRQDIPIMIFTLGQWSSLEKGEFHIGAAPVGPRKLGQNNKYVFALPPRYNFAFSEGYKEVEDILENDALQPKTKESNSQKNDKKTTELLAKSDSCKIPPHELAWNGEKYHFEKVITSKSEYEPGMKLGYMRCEEGSYSYDEEKEGIIVYSFGDPRKNSEIIVINNRGWGIALYTPSK
jgi:hypothetical protein